MHRHDLVWLHLEATWSCLSAGAEARLQAWIASARPLVVARRDPDSDGDALRLGVPLPLAEGRQRLALRVPAREVVKHTPALPLAQVADALPTARSTPLRRLQERLAARCDLAPPRVFGSHAWQALTGLPYLRPGSDLDLLWDIDSAAQGDAICALLQHWEADSGLRADGELRFPGQQAVNWREYASAAATVLVKGDTACWLSPRAALHPRHAA